MPDCHGHESGSAYGVDYQLAAVGHVTLPLLAKEAERARARISEDAWHFACRAVVGACAHVSVKMGGTSLAMSL